MTSELHAQLRLNIVDALFGFASTEKQQCWVKGHPDLIITFTETTCYWIDDLFCTGGIDGAVRDGWMSVPEADAVRAFDEAANAYATKANAARWSPAWRWHERSGYDDADILGDPEWAAVVRLAEKAWHALRLLLGGPERAMMDTLEQEWGAIP